MCIRDRYGTSSRTMRPSVLLVTLALLPLAVSGLYSASDGVVMLTSSNWKAEVMDSDQVVLVEFFAPWCGHCKQLAPEWAKAASALKGVVKVAAVDMDQHQALGAPYDVKGFPTIKIFAADKNKPKDYTQGRDAAAIAQAALQEAAEMVQGRMGGGGSTAAGPSAVVTLTDDNFHKEVLDSNQLWLVEFYAPWCGHCKQLEPQWAAASNELEGRVKLGALDATVHKTVAGQYGVKGFPTIKYFGADKSAGPQDYEGGRSKADIVTFGMDALEASLPPPEVHELVSLGVWSEACEGKSICLVGFLPGVVDSGVHGRNEYIDVINKLTESPTLKKFGFLWSSAQQQPGLEAVFGIGDYPAMVAVSPKKSMFVRMKGAFDSKELSGFLGRLMKGRERGLAQFELPGLQTHEPWDGKEEVVQAEEEMSLDDIMNENLDE
eukprot:TRINITY_DN14091_c0_g1_i1.p1 TRINITY_DN14091_c0_g1~~TRINITY_DN14091_c0_g1_i1.p1  ORF type:complete len:461 (-),score=156.44 TRINITY_DN14091_c0_g1_i1:103-1407(-)